MQIYNDESLYHHGKTGMKWGKRSTYGSMPKMITTKRQLSADTKTLDKMNNENHHISIGLTKKRQAAYDDRDKATLENRIEKNKVAKKTSKDYRAVGVKLVGNTLKFLGQNAMAVNRNHQAMKLSKMVTPD